MAAPVKHEKRGMGVSPVNVHGQDAHVTFQGSRRRQRISQIIDSKEKQILQFAQDDSEGISVTVKWFFSSLPAQITESLDS